MMKQMTTRRFMLENAWKEVNKKEMISIDALFDLMDQVHKLLMSYDEAIESRDEWKKKYKELKKK